MFVGDESYNTIIYKLLKSLYKEEKYIMETIPSEFNNKGKKYIFLPNKKDLDITLLSGAILFFMMMVFPRTYQLPKIPFLVIVLISILSVIILAGKIKLHKDVFLFFLIFMSYGLVWGSLGLINNKDFANDFLRLNVMWVFIYLLLVASISKERYMGILQKTMIWATLAISLYNINYYLYGIGTYHIAFLTTLDAGQRIGIHPGYIQLTAHNIGSLFFLIPFIISGILINKGKRFAGFSNQFLSFVLLVAIFAGFLSGRRMLWLIIIFGPIIYFIVTRLSKNGKIITKQLIKVIMSVAVLGFLIMNIFFRKMGWDYNNFIGRLTFVGEQETGISYRASKAKDMIAEVYEANLFFGTGGGSPAFEMTFIQTFHETGIVGVSIFLLLFLWVFLKIIVLIRQNKGKAEYGIPILVGSISFFLSMWSNPYFASFDFMWALFFPIAFINISLRNSKYEISIEKS